MTFKEASEFIITFGNHEDESIDDIASTDEGLRYLDWLSGEYRYCDLLRIALDVYLGDPAIKKELDNL